MAVRKPGKGSARVNSVVDLGLTLTSANRRHDWAFENYVGSVQNRRLVDGARLDRDRNDGRSSDCVGPHVSPVIVSIRGGDQVAPADSAKKPDRGREAVFRLGISAIVGSFSPISGHSQKRLSWMLGDCPDLHGHVRQIVKACQLRLVIIGSPPVRRGDRNDGTEMPGAQTPQM